MADKFVLGVNYLPRRKAVYWFPNFDAGEVDDDFALIADLGMDVVRIFLLWEDFQPTPDAVSRSCLDHLVKVCDMAARHGLGLDVGFFTGHMSGPNWAPGWLLDKDAPPPASGVPQVISGGKVVDSSYRNPFTDPVAIGAERLLLGTVVGLLKDHPALWMWNLGNEPDLFAWPPDAQTGRGWVREMTALIKAIDSRHPVTCGLHMANLHVDNGLRVDHVFAETDVATMHTYPMYTPWVREPLDPNLVPYTCALVSALCGKPTLMQEWGGCTAAPGQPSHIWSWTGYGRPVRQFMASEEDFAAYVQTVLPKLLEVGSTGAMMWCFADFAPELWDRPPYKESRHERFFGLVRPDGSLKPHAEVIKKFAATHPTVQPAQRQVKLDITADEFYHSPVHHVIRLYFKYLSEQGLW